MTEMTILPDQEDQFEYPRYSEPGWILVRVSNIRFRIGRYGDGSPYRICDIADIDPIHYTDGSAVFYIEEGQGIKHYIRENHLGDAIQKDGVYLLEGITGDYYPGEYGVSDGDEEFYCKRVRRMRWYHKLLGRIMLPFVRYQDDHPFCMLVDEDV